MLPWHMAADLTPCWWKKSFISRWILGLVDSSTAPLFVIHGVGHQLLFLIVSDEDDDLVDLHCLFILFCQRCLGFGLQVTLEFFVGVHIDSLLLNIEQNDEVFVLKEFVHLQDVVPLFMDGIQQIIGFGHRCLLPFDPSPRHNSASSIMVGTVLSSDRHLLQITYPLLHFQPWLECDDQLGGNHHVFSRAWVAGLSRFSLFDLEDSEIAKFDAAFLLQRVDDSVKNSLHDFLDEHSIWGSFISSAIALAVSFFVMRVLSGSSYARRCWWFATSEP